MLGTPSPLTLISQSNKGGPLFQSLFLWKIYFASSLCYKVLMSSSWKQASFRWGWLQPIKSLSCPLPWKEKQWRRFGLFSFKWFFIAIPLMFTENLNISSGSSLGIDISAFEFRQPLSHHIGSKFYKFCTNPKNSEFQFSYWSAKKNYQGIQILTYSLCECYWIVSIDGSFEAWHAISFLQQIQLSPFFRHQNIFTIRDFGISWRIH